MVYMSDAIKIIHGRCTINWDKIQELVVKRKCPYLLPVYYNFYVVLFIYRRINNIFIEIRNNK